MGQSRRRPRPPPHAVAHGAASHAGRSRADLQLREPGTDGQGERCHRHRPDIGQTSAEQGPKREPDGSWLDGARAVFVVDQVLWSREPTGSPLVLDGLMQLDLPPIGVTAAVLLKHDPQAAPGHRRLAAEGSMLISRNGVTVLPDRAPNYFHEFDGMPFTDTIARLLQATVTAAGPHLQEDRTTGDPSLSFIIAAAIGVCGASFLLVCGRRTCGHRGSTKPTR